MWSFFNHLPASSLPPVVVERPVTIGSSIQADLEPIPVLSAKLVVDVSTANVTINRLTAEPTNTRDLTASI